MCIYDVCYAARLISLSIIMNNETWILNIDRSIRKNLIARGEHADIYIGHLSMDLSNSSEQCVVKLIHDNDSMSYLSGMTEAYFLSLLQKCMYIVKFYGFFTDLDIIQGDIHDKIWKLSKPKTMSQEHPKDQNISYETLASPPRLPLRAFMILEYYEKGNLYNYCEKVARDNIQTELFCKWMYQLSCALKELQSLNIVHWDIKPQNIFLTDHLDIRLGDFNSASQLGSHDGEFRVGSGTRAYMAPEIFHKSGDYGLVDVYSMGATMYYILTGKSPFHGIHNPVQMIISIKKGFFKCGYNDDLTSTRIIPDIDEKVKKMIYRCLEPDPENRPSVNELLDFFKYQE